MTTLIFAFLNFAMAPKNGKGATVLETSMFDEGYTVIEVK
jgi:hypothetical protein